MNERLIAYNLNIGDPDESAAVTTAAAYIMVPFEATLVYVAVSPFEDDGSATIDILDDGTDIVTAVDASDHDVPGEWISVHCGGSETPVSIAAGSELVVDVNSGTAANRFDVTLLFLTGEQWG